MHWGALGAFCPCMPGVIYGISACTRETFYQSVPGTIHEWEKLKVGGGGRAWVDRVCITLVEERNHGEQRLHPWAYLSMYGGLHHIEFVHLKFTSIQRHDLETGIRNFVYCFHCLRIANLLYLASPSLMSWIFGVVNTDVAYTHPCR